MMDKKNTLFDAKLLDPQLLNQVMCQALRPARLRTGLTQVELSRRLGISQGKLSKLEQGKLEISAAEWLLFCHFTQTAIELPFAAAAALSEEAHTERKVA